MRLTLRTLLAHLDGVPLDSQESTEFAKKIEESEFVRNLVQRIRTSVTRPRLAAPKIDGQGLGHDPNTVAAYLDNTLPQDRMPNLEKICLESDVLLSEVASCHQILSLVLQHPAKVPSRLRERVYRIGDLGSAAPVPPPAPVKEPTPPPPVQEAPAQPAAAPPVPEEEKPEPRKREIPEYLQKTRSLDWKPLALIVVLGFLLTAFLLRLMGPFDANHPVLGVLAGNREARNDNAVAQQDDEAAGDATQQETSQSATKSDVKEEQEEKTAELTEADATGDTQPTDKAAAETKPPTDEGADTAANATTSPKAIQDDSAATAPNAVVEEPVEPGDVATPAPTTTTDDATTDDATPSDKATPDEGLAPAEGATTTDEGAAPAIGEVASVPPTTADPIPPTILDDASDAEAAAEPSASTALGRYISENEVLAQFNSDAMTWLRLPINAPLDEGSQLLALPAYRPKIVLASGIQITLSGGTRAELRAPQAPAAAHLAVEYGRVVVVPVGAVAGSVQLDLWGRQGEVTFVDPMSLMAIYVRQYRSPGIDPEAGLAHRMVEIYAVGGGLLWREQGHPDQPINAGEMFAFLDDARGEAAPTEQLPAWVERNDVERTDALAAQEVQSRLALERPLSRSLLELVEDRKSEVRALAVRSLTYFDLYEPFVDALNDETQKSYWSSHFDEIQRALARSPESAAEVRIALEKVRGRPAAADLYRLLWSYSPDGLARGDAERLVEYLHHESLDYRVLAIENLRRITGNTFVYFPQYVEGRRKVAVQRWREVLADGKIQYAEPPLMLPPRAFDEFGEPPADAPPDDVE